MWFAISRVDAQVVTTTQEDGSAPLMIQIDHHQGNYGPNIWLEIDSAQDLARLHSIFLMLARGSTQEIELCTTLTAHAVNLAGLCLRVDPSPRARRMRVVRVQDYQRTRDPAPRSHSFVWSDTRSGWKQKAEIVDSLLNERVETWRDLSEEGVDDALIEVSFRRAG